MLTVDSMDLLQTLESLYGFPKATEQNAVIWADALEGVSGDEVREALTTWVKDAARQPTPADLIRLTFERRRSLAPPPALPKTGSIPLAEGARQILEGIEARMKADGRIVPKRKFGPEGRVRP